MQSFLFYGFPQILNVKVVLKSSQNLVISNIFYNFATRNTTMQVGNKASASHARIAKTTRYTATA